MKKLNKETKHIQWVKGPPGKLRQVFGSVWELMETKSDGTRILRSMCKQCRVQEINGNYQVLMIIGDDD